MIPNASINKSIEYRKIESKVLELTRKNAEMEQVVIENILIDSLLFTISSSRLLM
jgi:hypothetical protein